MTFLRPIKVTTQAKGAGISRQKSSLPQKMERELFFYNNKRIAATAVISMTK